MDAAESVGERFRADFAFDPNVVLFNTAGVAPMSTVAEAAIQRMSHHL